MSERGQGHRNLHGLKLGAVILCCDKVQADLFEYILHFHFNLAFHLKAMTAKNSVLYKTF